MTQLEKFEKRKATELSRIMEDFQVSLDEALEIYSERRRMGGLIAGKMNKGKKTGFARSKEHARQAGIKGAEKRWGKK